MFVAPLATAVELPALRITSPQDGEWFTTGVYNNTWLRGQAALTTSLAAEVVEGEMPPDASIQWFVNGHPYRTIESEFSHGFYVLTARLVGADGNQGPLSSAVTARVCSGRFGEEGPLGLEIIWPAEDSVIPMSVGDPEKADIALLVRTQPPLEDLSSTTSSHTVWLDGVRTNLPHQVTTLGGGLFLWEFEMRQPGRHVVDLLAAGWDPETDRWMSGKAQRRILQIGESAPPPLPEGLALGSRYLWAPGGRLFQIERFWSGTDGDLVPVLPFPPATGWTLFGDGTNLVAVDSLQRLWQESYGWTQIMPEEPVSGWRKVASGISMQTGAAISDSGELFLWGGARRWAAGSPDLPRTTAVRVPTPAGVLGWVDVAVGNYHVLAISNEGRLFTWGGRALPLDVWPEDAVAADPYFGLVAPVPTQVPDPPGVSQWLEIEAGYDTSFALADNGEIYVWGDNLWGLLPVGPSLSEVLHPSPVVRPASVVHWMTMTTGGVLTAQTDNGAVLQFGVNGQPIQTLDPMGPRDGWASGGTATRWLRMRGYHRLMLLGDDGGVYRFANARYTQSRPVLDGRIADTTQVLGTRKGASPELMWDTFAPATPPPANQPLVLGFQVSDPSAGESVTITVTAHTRMGPVVLPPQTPGAGIATLTPDHLNGGWNTVMLQAITEDGRIGWSKPLHFVAAPAFVPASRVSAWGSPSFAVSPTYAGDPNVSPPVRFAADREVYILESSTDLRDWREERQLTDQETGMFLPPTDQPAGERRFYRLRWIESEY